MNTAVAEASYETSKAAAASPDPIVRRRIAGRADLRPELLYFLASDRVTEVRREVAGNAATPWQADELLSRDVDAEVRADLGRKLARLLPGMSDDAREEVRGRVVRLLETLARDQAARVRAAVSDAVKDLNCVPEAMVGELARDAVLAVAEPVLRFSPLLGEDDLLAIVAGPHADGAVSAIAGREALGERAAAAIVAAEDEAAVTVLLANPSAQVREETLDLIVQRAPGRPRWHAPLVERPALPERLVARIAAFVADTLLKRLMARPDLSAEAREAVAGAIRDRLAAASPAPADPARPAESPEAEARRLKREGKLDDDALWNALEAGRRDFVAAALAELSGLGADIVGRILAAHSAKGVVALVHKAGLSPRSAMQVQLRVAGISPRAALAPKSGGWPLAPDEMTWHLEFFGA
jgi:uncharacterized protein (DUF2336 family)